jgi:formylglycine-generating enzyme required for sulfatase activity
MSPHVSEIAEEQTPAVEPVPSPQTRTEEAACTTSPPTDAALPTMVCIPGRDFAVSATEVTFAQWEFCEASGGCGKYLPDDNKWGRGDRPVINVNWNDAKAYVEWLSSYTGQRYRLLTSEEWEFAARGGETGRFSWGDEYPACDRGARNGANFQECADRKTLPVGSFKPNKFGLFDMHGNVLEWVQDPDGEKRVIRGGSWDNTRNELRFEHRQSLLPKDGQISVVGFRVARSP